MLVITKKLTKGSKQRNTFLWAAKKDTHYKKIKKWLGSWINHRKSNLRNIGHIIKLEYVKELLSLITTSVNFKTQFLTLAFPYKIRMTYLLVYSSLYELFLLYWAIFNNLVMAQWNHSVKGLMQTRWLQKLHIEAFHP